jgi:multimeric flavodoxin WrbA
MKVIAFNGSPRKEGNTRKMIDRVLIKLNEDGIETEVFQLGGNLISGCMACMKCRENKNSKCVINKDIINECISKMLEADGIIIGSPTYFSNVTTEIKALIDRCGYVSRSNGNFLKRKVGAAVVAVRRAGGIQVFNSINDFFLINEMIVPGSSYWNLGYGGPVGTVENDDEGMKTMDTLGENIAWLLKRTTNL